jgi:hypothetical protein
LEDEGFRGYLTLEKNMTLCYIKTFFRRNKSGKKTNMKKMTPKRRFTEKKIGGVAKPYIKIGNTETQLTDQKLELFLENGTLTFDYTSKPNKRTIKFEERTDFLNEVEGPSRPNPRKAFVSDPPIPTGGPGRGNPFHNDKRTP